ncbi:MAG: 1,4-dihydroxy-6-naphthoate synthase [Desulfobulbaceae bacterium]|nr:1,4-dihydroxy-6-naphthoate synthase [Desulfobulbaceae bacterium]
MKNSHNLSLGYSPCPNDTFIFYGLVHDKISATNISFTPPFLEDVEQLNLWALEKRLDVTKLSFHALGHVLDEYCILSAGSALGRGCGPLLIAKNQCVVEELSGKRIAIPGKLTTAALLLQMFLPGGYELVEIRFDQIMQAVQDGSVDGGVIIHESRFTYLELGLQCVQDLGVWWEESTSMPIPLGCIAARRSLGSEVIAAIEEAIRGSVEYAFNNRQACLPYIQSNSQELAPEVVQSHIELYVNEFSRNLGQEGMAAVEHFLEKGRKAGALPYCPLGVTI